MAVRNFLKKSMYWLAVFLCILSIESVSESLDYQPATAIHGEHVQINGMGMADVSQRTLWELSAIRIEKIGYLTPTHSHRTDPQNVSGEVTASWYGPAHHNKLTASGQKFNMHKNTLAHRTLPLGTKVRLINPSNGKSVEGVVNDRGPYVNGRDVDVSYAMAKQLGFVKRGVVKLDMETI